MNQDYQENNLERNRFLIFDKGIKVSERHDQSHDREEEIDTKHWCFLTDEPKGPKPGVDQKKSHAIVPTIAMSKTISGRAEVFNSKLGMGRA